MFSCDEPVCLNATSYTVRLNDDEDAYNYGTEYELCRECYDDLRRQGMVARVLWSRDEWMEHLAISRGVNAGFDSGVEAD